MKKDKSLTQEEIEDLKQAFELFVNPTTNTIDTKEIFEALEFLNFKTKNPNIYEFFAELNNDENIAKGRIDFEQFIEAITSKLEENETKDGLQNVFSLLVEDPSKNTISIKALKKILTDLNDNMSDDEIKQMMSKVSSNGNEITFDEFFQIMKKGSFP